MRFAWRRVPLIATLMAGSLLAVACGEGGGAPTGAPGPSPGLTPTLAPTPVPSPVPSLAVTPTPAPALETIHGVEVVPFQVGDEVELPDNVALVVETGCYQCDGPPAALVRVYRDASGELRTDELFTAQATELPPRVEASPQRPQAAQPYIHSFALSSDASDMVVSVCSRGDCEWLGPASPDAQTTLFRSVDGGVTWAEFGTLDGWSYVVAIAKDGIVLWRHEHAQWAEGNFELFPSGDPIEPPAGADESWPVSLPGGELIWPTEDGRLVRSDGSQFLALGEGARLIYQRASIRPDPSGKRFAVVWYMKCPSGASENCYHLGVVSEAGQFTDVFLPGDGASVGGWINPNLLVGNTTIPAEELATIAVDYPSYLPALFDLDARRIYPMPHPFQEPPFRYGHDRIHVVLRGPFARVVQTGSCLNIRAEPDMSAQVLDCAADGVLLRDTGETRKADGVIWRRVVTPTAVEGWASMQYLEK